MKATALPALLFLTTSLAWAGAASVDERADSLLRAAREAIGIGKARPLLELSRLYISKNLDSARIFLDEAVTICRNEKDDTTLTRLVCEFRRPLNDAGQHELARKYLVMARDLTSAGTMPLKYQAMLFREFFEMHYWYFTEYDSCIYYAQKWVDVAPDSANRAWAYIELAVSHNELGNNIKALENYIIAESYLESPNADRWMLFHLNNNLGMLYADERELKKSESYFLKAVAYARNSNTPGAALPALNNLGVLYLWMAEYDKCLEYLALAAAELPLMKDPWSEANNVLNVGNALTLSGKISEGLQKYRQSLAMFTKLNEDYKVASLHRLMAEAYRLQRNYGEAEREALLALRWEHRDGYGDIVKESYAELYKIYGATGRFDKAFAFQSKYLEIVDSLNSAERRTKFGLLEKNFELAKQDRIRQKLEQENELHLAQARVDRTTRISLATGTVILAIGALVAVIGYRRSQAKSKKIEEQATQLQEASATKARFFANVSHELRTPVTLLNGMLELMREEPDKKNYSSKMDIALDSSRRLHRMLNDVLDLSRVDAGKWEFSRRHVMIKPVLNRIVFAFESLIVKKNLALNYEAGQLEGLMMPVDEDKFEKIINNLIYNAIKFNHDGGWISVKGSRKEALLVIEVADSGIGIPEKELPYIFDRFYQSSSTDKLNAQGIGIGLSLVREFTHLHGGEVTARSEVNKGSCFTVTLPVIGVPTSEPKEDHSDTVEVRFDLFETRPRVLVVEDNDDMRFYLKEILGTHVSIAEARHGREALAWLKSHKPDLIISDVMMPEMDGYEFLAQLKASEAYRSIPVVMLTARSAEEDLLHGLSLGVDDYIVKPFNTRELTIRVHNLLTNLKIRTEWKQKPLEPGEVAGRPDTDDQTFLEKIRAFVESNADSPTLGIGDLSDHLAISERQLYRKVATATGMSPAQLIKEIRLRIACKLLQERKVTKISDVAHRVGFENVAYFSRQFLERFGKRPAEFL